ncbi:MAG: FkbM family methyltransferase [Acidobacteria bacterium]|nr:FkbM family methyltransferase [Acidobacteriota bacterium]
MGVRDIVRSLAARAGLIVHRWPGNRFDAMHDALTLLRQAGYRPAIVIDCGANRGQFAGLVTGIFPDTTIHMIEPQAACWPALDEYARARGKAHVHRGVVTEPGVARVRMHRGGDEVSTGAFVIHAGDAEGADLEADATTLDALFGAKVGRGDRALLKLDIEGHEPEALRGAVRLLQNVEVVLTEVQFFDINRRGLQCFSDIAAVLASHGFELYDFATLGARRRDNRLRLGDPIFVRRDSPLAADVAWE